MKTDHPEGEYQREKRAHLLLDSVVVLFNNAFG